MPVDHTSARKNSRLIAVFQLSALSAALYLLVSLIMLSLLNFHAVWTTLLQNITGSTDQSALQPYTQNLLDFMGKLSTPVLMAFWAMFGILVFGIIWVIQNVIYTLSKEVEESHYLKGGVTPVRGYWHKAMESNLGVILASIVWLLYAALYISFLLPLASKQFFIGLNEISAWKQILDISMAVLINAASIYLFWNVHLVLSAAWRTTRG